jgi:hypothetical protein
MHAIHRNRLRHNSQMCSGAGWGVLLACVSVSHRPSSEFLARLRADACSAHWGPSSPRCRTSCTRRGSSAPCTQGSSRTLLSPPCGAAGVAVAVGGWRKRWRWWLVSGWSVVVAVGGGMQWQMGKSPEFAVVALVHALPCVGLGILRECAEHERECECGRACLA